MTTMPKRTRGEGCLSDLKIDRLLAGELDRGTAGEARAHIEGCARCAARIADIERGREAFLATPPPLPLPLRPTKNADKPSPRAGKLLRFAPRLAIPLAAAAAAMLFLARKPPEEELGTRLKGSSHLGVYVKHGGAVTRGAPLEVVSPGDTLQFTYSTDRAGYLAIISVDGAKKASVYYPAGTQAAAVSPGKDTALPSSVVLDDVLGDEKAYGLFCREAIELEPVRRAFEASPEKPPIPASCEVDVLPFVKKASR